MPAFVAATRGLANHYVGRLVPGLVDGEGKHGLKEDSRWQCCAIRYTVIRSIAGVVQW